MKKFSVYVIIFIIIAFCLNLISVYSKIKNQTRINVTILKITAKSTNAAFATEYVVRTTGNNNLCLKIFPEFHIGLKEGSKGVILKDNNFIYYNGLGLPIQLEKCFSVPLKKK